MQIQTVVELNSALDKLYTGIESDCRECLDPDCMGFIWLMEKEAEKLYEIGVPLVQINDGPTFIHSFPVDADGVPNLSVRYPGCSQLCQKTKMCIIHDNRPMVCHLYPLGLETKDSGKVVWVVHQDCLYIRRKKDQGSISQFEADVLSIINRISPELLTEILDTYTAVDAISSFPNGQNNYKILKEVSYV